MLGLRIRLLGLGLSRRHLGCAGAALRLSRRDLGSRRRALRLGGGLSGSLRGNRLLGLRSGVIIVLGHDRTFLLAGRATFGPCFDIPSIRTDRRLSANPLPSRCKTARAEHLASEARGGIAPAAYSKARYRALRAADPITLPCPVCKEGGPEDRR